MKKLITLILLTAACINGFTQANLYDAKYVRIRDSFSVRKKVISNIFTDTALTATQEQLPTVTAVKGYIDNRLNNLVFTTGSYANPSWITSLAYDKLTGAPTIPTVSGTTNYIPKFTGASSLGNSSILDNGTRVLIGTTTDNGTDNLQVNGSGSFQRQVRITHAAFSEIKFNNDNIRDDGVATIGLLGSNNAFGANNFAMFNRVSDLFFGAGDVERMRIKSNGNILIGTTTDAGYKLDVNGTARVQNNLVIGSLASSTARLNLPAGTATASTAPLKFTSGTNLTTPEDGAVEYDGTNLYITIAGVRHKLNNNVALTKVNTATYTVQASDEIISGLYGTTTTITLPPISSVPVNKVYEFTVHYTSRSPANALAYNIVCNSGDLFNDPLSGATGINTIGQYTTSGNTGVLSTKIISDGTKWILLQVPVAGLPY